MLSRVADSLYWMSRYLERAEHTARVMNVQMNLMLDRGAGSDDQYWAKVLRSLGIEVVALVALSTRPHSSRYLVGA